MQINNVLTLEEFESKREQLWFCLCQDLPLRIISQVPLDELSNIIRKRAKYEPIDFSVKPHDDYSVSSMLRDIKSLLTIPQILDSILQYENNKVSQADLMHVHLVTFYRIDWGNIVFDLSSDKQNLITSFNILPYSQTYAVLRKNLYDKCVNKINREFNFTENQIEHHLYKLNTYARNHEKKNKRILIK